MPRPAPVTRRSVTPRQVLGVASLGAVLAFVDATIVNVAFPDIAEDFEGTSLATISWVLNAYNIVFAAFLVAAGRVADLLGRKRLFEWGIVIFTLASVLCAVAPSVGTLVAARVLQALGAAIVVPASLALVLEAFPERERAHGVALWSAVAALAAGLGPRLGGVLVQAGGWRLAFLVNLPIGIVALMLSKRALVESRAPGRRTVPDLFGAAHPGGGDRRPDPRDHQGGRVGLDEPGRARLLRRRARARRGVRGALHLAPLADARPRAAADPLARRRQRHHARRGGRVLRLRPLQRPVPDERVGLQRARGRSRDNPRAVHRRRGGAPRLARWPHAWARRR